MAFLENIFGRQERTQQLPTLTPDQQALQNQIIGGVGGQLPQAFDYLSMLLSQDPQSLQQFQAPALRQFEEDIIPSIAERFTALGAQGSSAFPRALGQAGAGLAENLAAQRGQLGLAGLGQLQGLAGAGLQPRFETLFRPQTGGALGELATSGAGILGSLLGYLPFRGLL